MLKQIVLTRKIADAQKALAGLPSLEQRSEELRQLEAELTEALDQVTDETTDEDKAALESAISEFEEQQAALQNDTQAQADERTKLEEEIEKLQAELDDINNRAKEPVKGVERKMDKELVMGRMKFFRSAEVAGRVMEQQPVKDFAQRMRDYKGQKRAVTGGDLTIPDVLLELMRDNLHRYSKLIPYVGLVRVSGTARQTIAGAIPEGVWTEACANLNELAISFSQIELDGYKVGGFVPVCNALLEDSDINLVDEVMDMIGQAIGFAVDKAILYGTGTKMPVGIVTRLGEESEPAYWGANEASWTDLHASNIKVINPSGMTAEAFFSAIITQASIPRANYSADGGKFWAMNSKTFGALQAKALVFNAAGAIVSGQTQTMPIVGGDVVILEFIPDNDIIGGYGSVYKLAERAGAQLAVSEHVKFIEDMTVFRGTARYDGRPVFGESFVAFNIANSAVTKTRSFAADSANP